MSNYYIPCQIAPGVWHIYEPANVYSTLIVGKERGAADRYGLRLWKFKGNHSITD